MENNVKIVRFKDDLDVICFLCEKEDYTFDILEPMIFEIRNSNLVMQQWLPLAMLKENKVNIKGEDILCVMEPNDEFAEYFTNTVERINDANASKPKDKNEEKEYLLGVMDAMDELGSIKNLVLH
jgi:hypothetical protein